MGCLPVREQDSDRDCRGGERRDELELRRDNRPDLLPYEVGSEHQTERASHEKRIGARIETVEEPLNAGSL